MHLTTDKVLEKCRICGGFVIKRNDDVYCTGCYRNYDFLLKKDNEDEDSPYF